MFTAKYFNRTIKTIAMKTQRDTKRTSQSLFIVFVFLAMNAYSVSAENQNSFSYFSDSSNNTFIIATTARSANYQSYILETNAELYLAENSKSVKTTSSSDKTNMYYEAIEKEISLEDWMLSPKHSFWEDRNSVDDEDEIELEDWMLDASKW